MIEAIKIGEQGQITVPASYRKQHKLSAGSEVLLMKLGETLMLVPPDHNLDQLCQDIQETLTSQGVTNTQALKNLEKIRKKRFQRLYGKE